MPSLRSLSRSTVTDASGFHTRPWRGVDQETLTGPTQTRRKWRSRLHGRPRLARHSCSPEWRRAAPRLQASNPADPQSEPLIRPFASKSCSRGDQMAVTAPHSQRCGTSIECGVASSRWTPKGSPRGHRRDREGTLSTLPVQTDHRQEKASSFNYDPYPASERRRRGAPSRRDHSKRRMY